jgi:hypothetical protein
LVADVLRRSSDQIACNMIFLDILELVQVEGERIHAPVIIAIKAIRFSKESKTFFRMNTNCPLGDLENL